MTTLPPLTPEDVANIKRRTVRCTQATMLAFGLKEYPETVSGCLDYLKENGFVMRSNKVWDTMKGYANAKYDYILFTRAHAMALRNGLLVDTAGGSFDRRRVEFAWIVERVKEEKL